MLGVQTQRAGSGKSRTGLGAQLFPCFGRNSPALIFCQRAGSSTGPNDGASACAAENNTCLSGWCDAISTRTRRVFRTMAAPFLSSIVRIVAVQARSSSVSCKARAAEQEMPAALRRTCRRSSRCRLACWRTPRPVSGCPATGADAHRRRTRSSASARASTRPSSRTPSGTRLYA